MSAPRKTAAAAPKPTSTEPAAELTPAEPAAATEFFGGDTAADPQAEPVTEPAAATEFFGGDTAADPQAEPVTEPAAEPAAELTPAEVAAARSRADYVRALEEELDHVTRAGKGRDRIAGVEAEIARARTEADGRSLPPTHEA